MSQAGDNGDAEEVELEDEDFDLQQYDTMLELERLESIEEDMVDLGVTTLDEVRRRIVELHRKLDEQE